VASLRKNEPKRGPATYSVLFRLHGKQTSETFATQRGAEDFRDLVNLMVRMHGPHAGPPKALAELNAQAATGLTVDQLAERFFAAKATDVTPRTLDDYRRDYANWIAPAIGHRQADSIDETDVQGLVDAMNKRLDPKSVRDRHMILSSMFKWGSARTRRLVDHNPCHETELPKTRKKPVRGMTIPEWHAFYATARAADPDVADIALFLVATGWRWSEAAALTWAQVADYNGLVSVTVSQVIRRRPGEVGGIVADAKNAGSLRANDLGPLASDMLRRRMVGQHVDGFVFTNPQGRKWHQGNFLARHWAPIARTVFGETRKPTPHWLRHTHTLLLDRSGATLTEISHRLGHSDIKTTSNVYGGLIGDVSPEVLARVDAMLTPPGALELG
jgi:integrase